MQAAEARSRTKGVGQTRCLRPPVLLDAAAAAWRARLSEQLGVMLRQRGAATALPDPSGAHGAPPPGHPYPVLPPAASDRGCSGTGFGNDDDDVDADLVRSASETMLSFRTQMARTDASPLRSEVRVPRAPPLDVPLSVARASVASPATSDAAPPRGVKRPAPSAHARARAAEAEGSDGVGVVAVAPLARAMLAAAAAAASDDAIVDRTLPAGPDREMMSSDSTADGPRRALSGPYDYDAWCRAAGHDDDGRG